MLHHPDNDHWHEWREAVRRTGYTNQLSCAARALEQLEVMTPQQVEQCFASSSLPCHCFASTNIADEINYGTGKLDSNGFWEFPCMHRK